MGKSRRPRSRTYGVTYGVVAFVTVTSLALTGCFGGGAGTTGQTLRIALPFGAGSYSALGPAGGAFLPIRLGATQRLVDRDIDGKLNPVLTTSWSRTGPRVWTFQLRRGVRFHNGQKFDAAAAAKSLNYAAGLPAPPPTLQDVGLRAEATGPFTLQVTTARADPILPQRLADPGTAILAPAAYRSGQVQVQGMGTGPFEITAFTPEESITVSRYNRYWGQKAKLATVEAVFMPDPGSRVNALRAGDVDIAKGIPIAQIPVLRKASALKVITFPLPRFISLTMNMSGKPFSDKRVRRAVELAIDRPALAQQVVNGQGRAASLIFGPIVPYEQNNHPAGADPAEARALLQRAGYAPGDVQVRLWTYSSRPYLPRVATAIQQMLSKAGIKANITTGEYSSLETKVLDGSYDLFLMARNYNRGGASILRTDYTCNGATNYNNYCSQRFDALIAKLEGISDTGRRQALFRRAAERLNSQTVGVPLVHITARFGLRDAVRGFKPDPLEKRIITPNLDLAQ